MYTRMANACELAPREFWERILFTNFVLRVRDVRADRPTQQMYRNAGPRLRQILSSFRPRVGWVLGKEQSEFSVPIIREARIPFEVVAHPTSYGLKNAVFGASWKKIVERSAT